jgi:hypothetical protein
MPTTPANIGESLAAIAKATNTLFGFEAVPDTATPGEGWSRRIPLRGLRVSQALDLLSQNDDRYAWRESDGVINVRPKTAFDDPLHFLHRFVARFELHDALPLEATFAVHRIFRPSCQIAHPVTNAGRDEYIRTEPALMQRLLNYEAASTTVLDILNGVIRDHGGLHWNVSYPTGRAGYENSNFAFGDTPQVGGWWRMCVGDGQ